MKTLLEQYNEAVDRLPVTVKSPDGWVTVSRSDTGNLSVRLRQGAATRLTERQLTAEVRGALTSAYLTYRTKCRELRRQIIGPDVDKYARSN
ncbi:MAG: hypothetical protein WCA46_26515 [Actinocatenispora sp.]